MSDPTAALIVVAPVDPTKSVTVSSTPAVLQIFALAAEPEPGGDTETHGASSGLSLSLSLAL